jgi:DNA repair photolyase
MAMTYLPYNVKKILNVNKHIDGGWFWTKYSAHPYIGCQFGCDFCYSRDSKYLPYADPDDFDRIIKIKLNAAELLNKELSRVPVDLLYTGDYQPAEKEYKLSRKLLEVVLARNFPVFILERSPLVTRDLDLIKVINDQVFATVLFSVSYIDTETRKKTFESKSPAVKLRFKAMERIASQGILTGTALMPILPFISDSKQDLEEVIKITRESGGSFVLAGGLTLSGRQKTRYMNMVADFRPDLLSRYDELYTQSYSPMWDYWSRIANNVRELCRKYGINDRMPRWIPQGPMGMNKKLAEMLFLRVYDLELEMENKSKIWAYRKAAWAIDEFDTDIQAIYTSRGTQGLLSIPNIGRKVAEEIETFLIQEETN